MHDRPSTRDRIKKIIVQDLHRDEYVPEQIPDDAPLFGSGLGLDSVDALELVVAMEREFGIKIQSQEVGKEAFGSVATLVAFVDGRLAAGGSSTR